ncbi:LCP family protein [Salsuginibacillus kocurii]|uniref:LCP family protein n=1 Tax=Salsuginibacillus kocurii TaxID=427078 RepID=UPI000382EC77|nr:LCP family protein [Salsuginibacillus kocurii]
MISRLDRKKQRKTRLRRKLLLLTGFLMIGGGTIFANQYETMSTSSDTETMANQTDATEEDDLDNDDMVSGNEAAAAENDPLTFLLVGIDDEEEGGVARTDTIMLARYTPNQDDLRLASLMRDSYVEIPDHTDNKLNAAFSHGGIELLEETIEKNFDIEVDNYAKVNFDGFTEVVDIVAPDGIEIEVDDPMHYTDQAGDLSIGFDSGTHQLDGSETLKYVRYRGDQDNDFGRVNRQQEVLTLLKDELFSLSGVTKVPQLIGSIRPNIATDLSAGKMLSLGREALTGEVEDFDTLTVPVEGAYEDEYYSHAGAVLELQMEENREALHEFLGEDKESPEQLDQARHTNSTD